ncbi:Reverse transcriptase domain [Arabidopsis thaliana x Arabidopsis arenosa]|uniref:Reverse transcriptase domain n=1 Tax=Arabidopsis thaliana x Arabidopsis arenosa TaxID=1240361 RepID=A0A8T2AYF7_9BRAS|nr:Reverse transcriptase domain [Arabidopsis thaliana x Arabidopsis arenosa]
MKWKQNIDMIIDMEEHSKGDINPVVTSGMRDFQNVVTYCDISDMASHGPLFTWSNRRDNDPILKKLDRVMVNEVWTQAFPHSYNVFEAGGCSDHLRCRISLNDGAGEIVKGPRPFKFVNAVIEMEEFQPMVQEYWSQTEPLFMSTSTLFRFSKKLKALKPGIRNLARERMGDLVKKSKEAYDSLCQKQELNLLNPSLQTMEDETEAYKRWEKLARLEEKFLKQKSKLHWLDIGDQNNKTFHRAIMTRMVQNTIREIQRQDGSVTKAPEEIKGEAERFFREFLQLIPNDYEGVTEDELKTLLSFRCSLADKGMLTSEVTMEEIKGVLFSMPKDKSPGPDGFTSEFYKATWDIVGEEFVLAIKSFFEKGFLPKGVNSTILALIPKKLEVKEMKDYRPISCCNVIYKVISKILANRLKKLLPSFIAGNQSAFVQDRLLIENLLLATELVKDYHKDSISGRCAIKIDISKAFDSVQWSFLQNVLAAMDFPPEFVHWIMLCITTASFSVQVNGELAGFFQSSRGLRQGCSLSPYLFVICMDVLSRMLDKAAAARQFGYHPKCKTLGLTHLSFADDIMVLSDGKVRSIEGIVTVFDEFAKKSGLRISMEKSTIYMAGQLNTTHQEIQDQFHFEVGSLPVRYLGLPLLTKRLTATDFSPLIEQIKRKISSWTARYLSFAGRLNLISSVIWSLCNFWLSAFRLPRECIQEIDKICSSFLWSGPDLNSRKAKVAWDDICKPKSEGGLGLRSLKEANDVSCLKLIWKIISHGNSLWVKWIEKFLLKKDTFWSVKNNTTIGSWMWKKLLKFRDLAKTFCKVEVNNGSRTSFWYDDWSTLGRLLGEVGERGMIDMGISRHQTVAEAWEGRRRRRHRSDLLNQMEAELATKKQSRNETEDIVLWRGRNNVYKPRFSTKDTWNLTRTEGTTVSWHKGVWIKHGTPKLSFCVWLAARNRLSTGDRMIQWNRGASVTCCFCNNATESRDHLFFACGYISQIWEALAKNLYKTRYSTNWYSLLNTISAGWNDRTESFVARYVLHATLYTIWRERNGRKHGDQPNPAHLLIKWIDRQVRNRLSSIRKMGDRRYDKSLQIWFQARS